MSSKLTIAISGGGTGGHITPAIAIGKALIKNKTAYQIIYIGSVGGPERISAINAGFPFYPILVKPFHRRRYLAILLALILMPIAIIQSLIVLLLKRIRIVVVTGGYVSGPVVIAAKLIGRQFVMHEQNAYPGIVVRKMAGNAGKIFLGYEQAGKHLTVAADKIVVSGNPVRNAVQNSKSDAMSSFRLPPANFTVFFTGGSGGALKINTTVNLIFKDLTSLGINVIWQTGKNWEQAAKPDYDKGLFIAKSLTPEQMYAAYCASDLVVSRCGAMTLAEIAAFAKPAILIPYPYAADNHQLANAKALTESGAAELILDKDLTSETLITRITDLYEHKEVLGRMSGKMLSFAKSDVAEKIANEIWSLVQ